MDKNVNNINDLGRYQRVLDAYLAHPGADSEPPPALNAKLIDAAQRALVQRPAAGRSSRLSAVEIDAEQRKFRPRRRWPMALAASVATIGFATMLARNSFQETPSLATAPAAVAPAAESSAVTDRPAIEMSKRVALDANAQTGSAPPIEAKTESAPEATRRAAHVAPPIVAPPAPSPPLPSPLAPSGAGLMRDAPEFDSPEFAGSNADAGINANAEKIAAPSDALAAPAVAMPPPPAAPATPPVVMAPAEPAFSPESRDQALEEITVTGARIDRADEEDETASPILNIPQSIAAANADQVLQDAAIADKKDAAPRAARGAAPGADVGAAADQHAKIYSTIRALHRRGKTAQAKAMLARFTKAYPEVVLPKDLQALASSNKH